MNSKLVILSSMVFLAIVLSGRSDDFPNELERWYVTEPPKRGSEQYFVAQVDLEHEWVVTPGKTGPQVSNSKGNQEIQNPPIPFEIKPGSPKEGLAGRRIIKKVNDGWIIGFNAGEFGAGLWWFSPEGKKRYKVSDDHVLKFIAMPLCLVAIEGIEHGTISEGKAICLSKNEKGRWISEPLIDFGEAPKAAIKDGDSTIMVVTSKRLIRADIVSALSAI